MKTNEVEGKLDVMELMVVKGGINSTPDCSGGNNNGVHCTTGAIGDKEQHQTM